MENRTTDGVILIENTSSSVPTILTDNRQSITIEAELQEVNARNRNDRIYDDDAVWGALTGDMVQEKLRRKSFYGRLCPSLQ
jgi:hypothetical protein